jgi:hypothetical protein
MKCQEKSERRARSEDFAPGTVESRCADTPSLSWPGGAMSFRVTHGTGGMRRPHGLHRQREPPAWGKACGALAAKTASTPSSRRHGICARGKPPDRHSWNPVPRQQLFRSYGQRLSLDHDLPIKEQATSINSRIKTSPRSRRSFSSFPATSAPPSSENTKPLEPNHKAPQQQPVCSK